MLVHSSSYAVSPIIGNCSSKQVPLPRYSVPQPSRVCDLCEKHAILEEKCAQNLPKLKKGAAFTILGPKGKNEYQAEVALRNAGTDLYLFWNRPDGSTKEFTLGNLEKVEKPQKTKIVYFLYFC